MSGELRLRTAVLADALDVWVWRNDPVARAASRHTDEIPVEVHLQWFPAALASQTLLIAELDGHPAGLVRITPGEQGAVVSINLAPDRRGQGLGGRVLAAALKGVQGDLLAEIREDNTASRRIFERCGFREVGRDGDFVQLRRP